MLMPNMEQKNKSSQINVISPDDPPKGASEAFSQLLCSVGGYGKWQWRLLFITSFCGVFTSFHNIGAAFLAYTPNHRCLIPGYENISRDSQDLFRQISSPWFKSMDEEWKQSTCEYYNRNYGEIFDKFGNSEIEVDLNEEEFTLIYQYGNFSSVTLEKAEIIKCTKWEYDTDVFQNTVVTEWDLVCDRKWLKSCAQSTYMGGILFGAVVISELSDKFGRQKLGIISAVGFLISSILTIFSQSYIMFLILRFIVATFSSGIFLSNYVNCMESVSVEGRTVIGILYHAGFAVGFAIIALFAYLIRSWRYLQFAWSAPIVILLSYFWILPESPRWLMTQGRHEEAMVIIRKIAKVNGGTIPNDDELSFFLANMSNKEKKELTLKDKFLSLGNSFKLLLRTRNMRRRNLIMFYAWFVVSMIYYGVTFSAKNIDASVFLTVGLGGFVEIPSLIIIWVLGKIGRRGSICLVLIATSISCLFILAVPKDMMWLKLTLNTVAKFFMSPAFNVVFLMSAELVPTHVRNIAVGTSSMFARIGSGIAPFIVDLLGEIHSSIPSVAFGVFALTSGLLSFLLPETANLPLPESIDEIEAMPR